MSIASLITGGLGDFSTVALLTLDGLGDFPSGAPLLGGDYSQWETPPFGHRRVLDTEGVDLAAQERTRLDRARREIGLLRDKEPPPLPVEIEAVPVEARIIVEPDSAMAEPVKPVRLMEAELVAAELRRLEAEDIARAERRIVARAERRRREDESVLMLLAGVL